MSVSFYRFCLFCFLCLLMLLVLLDVKLSHDDYCEGKRQQECNIVYKNGRTPIIMSEQRKERHISDLFSFANQNFSHRIFPMLSISLSQKPHLMKYLMLTLTGLLMNFNTCVPTCFTHYNDLIGQVMNINFFVTLHCNRLLRIVRQYCE